MTLQLLRLLAVVLSVASLAVVPVQAGYISFDGQFDPTLATFDPDSGNGSFDPSAAPFSITLYGSNPGREAGTLTRVSWSVTSADSDLTFLWEYETWNVGGPAWDPAGFYLNGILHQLSDDGGSSMQSGVGIVSISPGDEFGFYVLAFGGGGEAQLTISGLSQPSTVVPEPSTVVLFAVGFLGLYPLWKLRVGGSGH